MSGEDDSPGLWRLAFEAIALAAFPAFWLLVLWPLPLPKLKAVFRRALGPALHGLGMVLFCAAHDLGFREEQDRDCAP